MSSSPAAPSLNPEQFREHFAAMLPLILDEWADLTPDHLEATQGELDQVVDYIASTTERTRTLIRRQLRELYQIAVAEAEPPAPQGSPKPLRQLVTETLAESDLQDTIAHLEQRTEKLLAQFKQDVLPELNEKVQKNVGGSLLTALGIGFILGVLVGGGRGR